MGATPRGIVGETAKASVIATVGGFALFDRFDAEVAEPARRAQVLCAHVARLAKQLRKGADFVDIHLLRQKAAEAVVRGTEAAAALELLNAGVRGLSLAAGQDASATGVEDWSTSYGAEFERACAALGVPLEGAYPDYRVFPFEVHLRPREERVLIGRKSWWALRPDAVAKAVKRERDRLMGGSFAADRFGLALTRVFDLLIQEVRARSGPGAQQVALRDVLAVLQLPTFGRASYTKDEFAFDIYRYRQTSMVVGGRRVTFGDLRNAGAGFEVPNARGGRDRLTGLQVADVEGGSG